MEDKNTKIPEVMPLDDGHFVTVPSAAWNALCSTINNLTEAVNIQSKLLESAFANIDELKNTDKVTNEYLAKLAGIVEEIYETLD